MSEWNKLKDGFPDENKPLFMYVHDEVIKGEYNGKDVGADSWLDEFGSCDAPSHWIYQEFYLPEQPTPSE